MICYSDKNVYQAALERIELLFEDFYGKRKMCVDVSGGKDSTVILFLVKEVMDKRGIKKFPVFFLDQEAEAPQTIDTIREIMNYEWVEPYWVQSHFREWNSSKGDWFNVWGPGEKWCRDKEEHGTYTDLDFKVKDNFPLVLDSAHKCLFGDDYIALGGLHIDESPNRRLGLTQGDCHKGITWGKNNGKAIVFYPIWDWTYNDVWYYIFSNRLPYCKLYNYYFTRRPLRDCRVSSFIHENSIQSLKDLREISPEAYKRILQRVENVNTTVQIYSYLTKYVSKLPPYFADWKEYVLYLNENLTADPKNRANIEKGFLYSWNRWHKQFNNLPEFKDEIENTLGVAAARSVVAEDFALTKMINAEQGLAVLYFNNYERITKHNQK